MSLAYWRLWLKPKPLSLETFQAFPEFGPLKDTCKLLTRYFLLDLINILHSAYNWHYTAALDKLNAETECVFNIVFTTQETQGWMLNCFWLIGKYSGEHIIIKRKSTATSCWQYNSKYLPWNVCVSSACIRVSFKIIGFLVCATSSIKPILIPLLTLIKRATYILKELPSPLLKWLTHSP